MARAPRAQFRGAPRDPKGSGHNVTMSGHMRVGHPTPPSFSSRKQQKQWYRAQYKNGVVARGTGVVTTYKRGRLVKSNAGVKTLSQKKVNLARRRHRINVAKKTGKGALALGAAAVGAYGFAAGHPATAAKTKAFTKAARGKYTHRANAMKIKRSMRRSRGGRVRRDRFGMFA
jgi:hypothetical protein